MPRKILSTPPSPGFRVALTFVGIIDYLGGGHLSIYDNSGIHTIDIGEESRRMIRVIALDAYLLVQPRCVFSGWFAHLQLPLVYMLGFFRSRRAMLYGARLEARKTLVLSYIRIGTKLAVGIMESITLTSQRKTATGIEAR